MTQEQDHSQDPEEQGLTEDTLVLDFLDQAGVTERLNRPGTQDVAINRPTRWSWTFSTRQASPSA
ncbi:hypothetical protein [Pseudomonas amygdali]|uniref:hypothetical protein n=1 Tax=Pseudomonas amygdali TaxID=47877 RepID=UPI000C129AEB|nr:hypothetical protein [Pseudomonas amygdali]PHX25839.1 hypothetical protein AO282_26450 [Pseudomonas amygdali pv. morsprunorum]